jgi:signal transduction protein with GAF and PtsI domain
VSGAGDGGRSAADDAEPGAEPPAPPDPRLLDAIRALAVRVEAASRLTAPGGAAILRSIVDATVGLFAAEAASIALYDATTDRLVFEVAAGSQGEGVVGLAIDAAVGVAGYVFSTGQPIAISDVASDARFGRSTAERTGYVPRSLLAVPLMDDDGSLGVLEVLDKRDDAGFDLHDVELAELFARQATVAIRASRIERDTASLLRTVLVAAGDATNAAEVEEIVAGAVAGLAAQDDDVWLLADEIARLRRADPREMELVRELLAVLIRRANRRVAHRPGAGAGLRR